MHLTIDRSFSLANEPSMFAIASTLSLCGAILAGLFYYAVRGFKSCTLVLLALFWVIPTSTLQPLALLYDETRLYFALGMLALLAAVVWTRHIPASLKQAASCIFIPLVCCHLVHGNESHPNGPLAI